MTADLHTGHGYIRTAREPYQGPRAMLRWVAVLGLLCVWTGCKAAGQANGSLVTDALQPSNHRRWQPSLSVLPHADIRHDKVRISNIRNCYYFTEDTYAVRYYDAEFPLDELRTVDFIVVPFKEAPSLAHTMLSFGFKDGRHLAVSVEARLEEGEVYSPLRGALRQYELMYVVADERDVIQLRTEHRNVDVYLYRTSVSPENVRKLFVDMMQRANELEKHPEFYDTLTNNCTTNIVRHVNRIRPGRIPPSISVLLSGHSDRLAYDLGLIDTSRPFEQTRQAAKVNVLAHLYRDDAEFSRRIRR